MGLKEQMDPIGMGAERVVEHRHQGGCFPGGEVEAVFRGDRDGGRPRLAHGFGAARRRQVTEEIAGAFRRDQRLFGQAQVIFPFQADQQFHPGQAVQAQIAIQGTVQGKLQAVAGLGMEFVQQLPDEAEKHLLPVKGSRWGRFVHGTHRSSGGSGREPCFPFHSAMVFH